MWTEFIHRLRVSYVFALIAFAIATASFAQENGDQHVDPTGAAMPEVKNLTTPQSYATNHSINKKARPKVALALGGGGMRGAAHVGVIRALLAAGIPIDFIAGTSMGAVVGGLFSAGIDINTLTRKFEDGSLMKSFMPISLKLTLVAAPAIAIPKALDRKDYDGLYSGKKFRRYIDHSVPEYRRNIEGLGIPFAAVALDLVDGKPYALTRGNLGTALLASTAVPGLREPVRIGNQVFVDGGVVDNIPVDVARSMGGDIVIAVNVDERFDSVPPESFKAIGSVTKRMLTLQLASSDALHLQKADFVIHPIVDGIGLTSTNVKDARDAIEAGEKAAKEGIPNIQERLKQMAAPVNLGD